MFQYAAGLALAHSRRTVLKLDVTWFREDPAHEDHNRFALDCLNVNAQFATQEEIERVKGVRLTRAEKVAVRLARAFHFYQYANRFGFEGNYYSQPAFGFEESFLAQPDNTYLHGLFQSAMFFMPVENMVRQSFSFRYPALPQVAKMAESIRSANTPVAVHFRRGDYVRNEQFRREIGVLGLDYYYRATRLLQERFPNLTLFVFSDDIDSIEREFSPNVPCVFVRATQPWHSYDKIRLMNLCQHYIISNSTFSWWGAWLNASPTKVVIAPEPWFVSGAHVETDLIPSNWLRLPISAT